jgi:tetratricopeptide (TPR) repeat protein
MGLRHLWLGLGLVCFGCQTMAAVEAPAPGPAAGELWEQGQSAMRRGSADEAIRLYQQSLEVDPQLSRNYLSLAAAYLEKGDDAAACPHLSRYLTAHPEHLVVRGHFAELLLRMQRMKEARAEFERFVADAQDQEDQPAARQLIHCHSRLMEIAEASEDEYNQHLNRGIGLFLLARERAVLPDAEEGVLPTEGLLCKAAGELTLARLERPDEARPQWYLYEVWSRLPARKPALTCLRAAEVAAPFSYLTPAEQRSLQLACKCQSSERAIK